MVRRLLLIQPRWMGDVLLCTPAARVARQAFPDARIDFLTEAAGAAALAGNRHLDEILVSRPGSREQLSLLRSLWRRGYDTAVGFRSTNTTAQFALASRATRRIATRGRGPRNLAFTDLVPRSEPHLYMVRQKLSLLAPLGVDVDGVEDLSLEIHMGEADHRWAEETWQRLGLEGTAPVVAISAVARDSLKQWGPGRWAEVADALIDAGARVLLTHGAGELEQVQEVVSTMRHRPAWGHGPTTPQQLAALYRRATLWVGNDGGPKHIAAAAGIPTLSIQRSGEGPAWTDSSEGSGHRYVEGVGDAGDPRGGLDRLEVPRVVEATLEMLGSAADSSRSSDPVHPRDT